MKKTIILLGMVLILASLAAAEIEQAYPSLVGGDASLNFQERNRLHNYLEENPRPVLENEEKVEVLSLESWIDDLSQTPPPAYKRKMANLDEEVAKYETRFALSEEEMAKINQLSDEEKAYLVATLGRSRGQRALFYEGTMGSPLFSYIVFHENFHTFTNPMFTADSQARLVQANMERASEQREADLMKELEFLKQRAEFLILWKRYVGSEKIVGFSNYGRTNVNEQLSEFFARLNTGYFVRDLREMEPAEDNRELRGYIAAFVLADCAELFESFDVESGAEIRQEILEIIEDDLVKKKIYNDLQGDILRRTSCPMEIPEAVMETKEAYECDWERGGAGDIKVTSCELTEVSELSWSPELDSAYLSYDEDGNVVDAGYFKANEIMVTNYLAGGNIVSETQFVGLDAGRMFVEQVPGLETTKLFESSADGLVAQEVEFSPRRLANSGAARKTGLNEEKINDLEEVISEVKKTTGTQTDIVSRETIGDCVEVGKGTAKASAGQSSEIMAAVNKFQDIKKGAKKNKEKLSALAAGALQGDEQARTDFVQLLYGVNDAQLFLMNFKNWYAQVMTGLNNIEIGLIEIQNTDGPEFANPDMQEFYDTFADWYLEVMTGLNNIDSSLVALEASG